jgi:hypothetical protein
MDAMTRKSHGGFINFVNNGAVSYQFCQQQSSQMEKQAAKHRHAQQLRS